MNDATTQTIRTVHAAIGVATSISTDGTTAMLSFKDQDGEAFGLTLPVAGLAMLRQMCTELIDSARKRDVGAGNVAPKFPKSFSVGNSPMMRGKVALMFDPETPDEAVYALTDQAALQMATAIRMDLQSRLTAADIERMALAATPRKGLLLPGLGG